MRRPPPPTPPSPTQICQAPIIPNDINLNVCLTCEGTPQKEDTLALKDTTAKEKNIIPSEDILQTKFCKGCDASVYDLTVLEKQENKKLRAWFYKNYYADICMHCGKMSQIRYPDKNRVQYSKFLDLPDQQRENKMYSVCFISIRAEGRTQVTVQMLENRLQILFQVRSLFRDADYYCYIPLDKFVEDNPDTDPRSLTFVQMVIDGVDRIGIKQLRPSPIGERSALPFNGIDERIATKNQNDIDALTHLQVRHDLFSISSVGAVALPGGSQSPDSDLPGASGTNSIAVAARPSKAAARNVNG